MAEEKEQKGDLPQDLDEVKIKCDALIKKLQQYIGEEVEAVAKLKATDSGIAGVLGNHVFRTDNPKRLKNTIKHLEEYKDALKDGVSKANSVISNLNYLGLVHLSMKKWQNAVKALFPVTLLRMTFPNIKIKSAFKNYKFDKKAFEIVLLVQGIILGLGCVATMGALIPLAASILAITAIVGGIIAGEQNKKLYNKMDEDAKNAKQTIDKEVIAPLNETLANLSKFWGDAGKALAIAGYLENSNETHLNIANAVKELAFRVERYATAVMMFNGLTKKQVNDEELALYAKSAAMGLTGNVNPSKEAIDEFKLIYYMQQKELNVGEIAKILKINEKEARKLKVKQLLDEGKPPSFIAEKLEMPENQVKDIQKAVRNVFGG